jgi:hypothetical protein
MFDTESRQTSRSTIQVFLGFLLGVVACLGCLFLAIFFGSTLGPHSMWIYPVFNAFALIAVGIVALRHARQSSYAMGVVIALSLALLLDAACAVAVLR